MGCPDGRIPSEAEWVYAATGNMTRLRPTMKGGRFVVPTLALPIPGGAMVE
jgi:hypothetical protein